MPASSRGTIGPSHLLYVNSDKGNRLLSVYHAPDIELAALDSLCSPLNLHASSLTDAETAMEQLRDLLKSMQLKNKWPIRNFT